MNLVLDDAEEINIKKNTRKTLGREFTPRYDSVVFLKKLSNLLHEFLPGRILLKGDNITLMMNT